MMIIVTMLVLICVLGRLPIYLLIIRTHSLYYSYSFYFRNSFNYFYSNRFNIENISIAKSYYFECCNNNYYYFLRC